MLRPIEKYRRLFDTLISIPGDRSLRGVHEQNILYKIIDFNSANQPSYDAHYLSALNKIILNKSHLEIPTTIFKYYDFQGGCKALGDKTIKFSNALNFKKPGRDLSDRSELDHGRFYIDEQSLIEFEGIVIDEGWSRYSAADKFSLFYVNHYFNTYEKNKVCSFSSSYVNEYLWGQGGHQICIEYDSSLFKNSNFSTLDACYMLYNKVQYVDELIKFPLRYSSDEWLKNLFFIKKADPYVWEDEFRVVLQNPSNCPRRYSLDKLKYIITNDFKETDVFSDAEFKSFDSKYIKKVYFKNGEYDVGRLFRITQDLEIPLEILD